MRWPPLMQAAAAAVRWAACYVFEETRLSFSSREIGRERGKFITRQPTKGGKDDCDSGKSCISALILRWAPQQQQKKDERRGDGGKGRVQREGECDQRRRWSWRTTLREWSAKEFSESVREITLVGIAVIVIVGQEKKRERFTKEKDV